jgi:anti-sigma factor RsiW
VSHLGDNLSALVDGELVGADLDRANAHLASCEDCRRDAAALRVLKSQLRALTEDSGHDELVSRLLAMPGQPMAFAETGDGGGLRVRSVLRRRRVVWSALSLAVVGGVGVAAFQMGGGQQGREPSVIPQVKMFSTQNAATSRELPFPPTALTTRAARRKP